MPIDINIDTRSMIIKLLDSRLTPSSKSNKVRERSRTIIVSIPQRIARKTSAATANSNAPFVVRSVNSNVNAHSGSLSSSGFDIGTVRLDL